MFPEVSPFVFVRGERRAPPGEGVEDGVGGHKHAGIRNDVPGLDPGKTAIGIRFPGEVQGPRVYGLPLRRHLWPGPQLICMAVDLRRERSIPSITADTRASVGVAPLPL